MTEAYNYSYEVLDKLAGVLLTDTQTERVTSLRDFAKAYVVFISKERADAVLATEEILKTFEKKGFLGVKKYSLVTGEGTSTPCLDGEIQNPHTAQVLEAYMTLQDSAREDNEQRLLLARSIIENPDFSDLMIILDQAQQKGAREAISAKEAQKAYFPDPKVVFSKERRSTFSPQAANTEPGKVSDKPSFQPTTIRRKVWNGVVGRR